MIVDIYHEINTRISGYLSNLVHQHFIHSYRVYFPNAGGAPYVLTIGFRIHSFDSREHLLSINLDQLLLHSYTDSTVITILSEVQRRLVDYIENHDNVRRNPQPQPTLENGDSMAQWNSRANERLQAQEAQRRDARNRSLPLPDTLYAMENSPNISRVVRDGMQREIRNTPLMNQTTADQQMYYTLPASSPIFPPGLQAPDYIPFTRSTTPVPTGLYPEDTYLKPINTNEEIEKLLLELLSTKLDINVSMDESDGEVTTEVVIKFDGRIITSDSDSITIQTQ